MKTVKIFKHLTCYFALYSGDLANFTQPCPFLISFFFHSFFYITQTVFEGLFQVLSHLPPLKIKGEELIKLVLHNAPNAKKKGREKQEYSSQYF